MAKKKRPAFQFYPKDFISDINVVLMSMEERGIYITLLCHVWIEGFIPDDAEKIRLLTNHGSTTGEPWLNQWESIRKCFYKKGNILRHKRIDEERKKQIAFSRQQSIKGKKSAAARGTMVKPMLNQNLTMVEPAQVNSLSSSKKEKNILSSKLKEDIKTIVSYLNEKTGKAFRDNTDETKKHISGRLSEDFTVEDFKKVIDNKTIEWLDDVKFEKFLRPETLFCKKHFESYLNEIGKEREETPEEYYKRQMEALK